MAVYARHAPIYADAGLPVFPVDTRNKRPAVRGWQKATARRARGWATKPDLAKADGIGIVMGPPSRLVEVDVDAVGDAWVSAAIERFGNTPIIIRTASGKAKLWYRHNGEGRHIRPFHDLPIDVLGGGFTIAPPSWRVDLGEGYRFLSGGLDSLRDLPAIRDGSLSDSRISNSALVRTGERNTQLFHYCGPQARFCDDVEALIDVALTWNSALPDPLSDAEAAGVARKVWAYECEGKNIIGLKKPQLNDKDRIMDDLIGEPSNAYGFYLYLDRWHSNRPHFAIAPRAMSEAGSPPWPRRQIERARDVLLEKGYLEEIRSPDQRRRKAGLYRLAQRLPISGHNHYTLFSSSLDPSLVEAGR